MLPARGPTPQENQQVSRLCTVLERYTTLWLNVTFARIDLQDAGCCVSPGSGFGLRWVLIMSLRAVPFPEIPVLTAEVARAAFPGGTLAMRLRDELGGVYESTDFLRRRGRTVWRG